MDKGGHLDSDLHETQVWLFGHLYGRYGEVPVATQTAPLLFILRIQEESLRRLRAFLERPVERTPGRPLHAPGGILQRLLIASCTGPPPPYFVLGVGPPAGLKRDLQAKAAVAAEI